MVSVAPMRFDIIERPLLSPSHTPTNFPQILCAWTLPFLNLSAEHVAPLMNSWQGSTMLAPFMAVLTHKTLLPSIIILKAVLKIVNASTSCQTCSSCRWLLDSSWFHQEANFSTTQEAFTNTVRSHRHLHSILRCARAACTVNAGLSIICISSTYPGT